MAGPLPPPRLSGRTPLKIFFLRLPLWEFIGKIRIQKYKNQDIKKEGRKDYKHLGRERERERESKNEGGRKRVKMREGVTVKISEKERVKMREGE